MQHVLRCWERQSDGSEYKKTLRRPGLHPDPAEGAYSAPANPLAGGEELTAPPKNPIPCCRPFGPRLSYPHSKTSSDAVVHHIHISWVKHWSLWYNFDSIFIWLQFNCDSIAPWPHLTGIWPLYDHSATFVINVCTASCKNL